MDKELLSCPFCNGKVKYVMSCRDHGEAIAVYCSKCNSETNFYNQKGIRVYGQKEISKKWNRRNENNG